MNIRPYYSDVEHLARKHRMFKTCKFLLLVHTFKRNRTVAAGFGNILNQLPSISLGLTNMPGDTLTHIPSDTVPLTLLYATHIVHE